MSDLPAEMKMRPEFTGDDLLRFVIDLEAVVGTHRAGLTPLGAAVMNLAEAAADNDEKR